MIFKKEKNRIMKVYLVVINYGGWEDIEANDCNVMVYATREGARKALEEAVEKEIEEEKGYGRDFSILFRNSDYVSIVSQCNEYVDFTIQEKEVIK